ncbi:Oidioi.mRNA.OKI2018_I69.chr2.g5587.t1.cds [Oikopleura dioica]|uniref:Oidioi.mRNA.OKI2018_I69.chr2.g5587.t1.cds n=1 Tax=Oikopleura dioica TaxID=34765 RepID=A0ABN7T9X6_OIKDI|nr:Oidioi.mRNA.OKI2018_I69.chr2.g5587.t1.cds [Oikopleura dioica]
MYRQFMIQIQSLDQYKHLLQPQLEQLVLQHMAAMLRPTLGAMAPQQVPAQPAYVDPEAERRRLLEEEQARKIEEERLRIENEKREALEFENMLKAQEEKLREREEQLRQKEMSFLQQQDFLRRQEEERLKEEEAQRAEEEAKRKAQEEEERRQLELQRQQEAEAQRQRELEEQRRLEEERILEEKRAAEQRLLFEQQKAQEQAKILLDRQNAEKARKEEAEKRRKKEEEKRQQEAKKAAAERKKLEAEQLAKRQEQIRKEQERAAEKAAKKEAEKKERERKAAEEKARKAREDAKKWNAPVTPVTSVPSFKDLQAKDEEEQKIEKKAKEIETAQKRAAEKVVVQSKGQSGWAGLVRGGTKTAPVPVSPVVAQKITSKAGQQSAKKSASKNGTKTPKAKNDDLGFWDTAVTAVLTEPTAVNKVMSTPNKKSAQQNADEANARSQFEKLTLVEDPLLSWARIELEIIPNSNQIDIPTFVSFLREVEHDYEVEDYSRQYFGNGKEVLNFAHKFMEKRKQIRNEGTASKKSNRKKKNKNKATADLLGFTPAAGDQRNREGQLEGRF